MKFIEIYARQNTFGKLHALFLCINAIATHSREFYEKSSENFDHLIAVNELVGKLSGHAASMMEGEINLSGDESMGELIDFGLRDLLGDAKVEIFLLSLSKHLITHKF